MRRTETRGLGSSVPSSDLPRRTESCGDHETLRMRVTGWGTTSMVQGGVHDVPITSIGVRDIVCVHSRITPPRLGETGAVTR